MMELWLGGGLGILLGLLLEWAGALLPSRIQGALALRSRYLLKVVLFALGTGTMLTAALGWLAVLDVDRLSILPLHGGVVVGGLIFGLGYGVMGRCELTALGGLGGGQLAPSLCAVAGGLCGAMLWALLTGPLSPVFGLIPVSDATLFRVTLRGDYLWSGGFLGHGCLGLLLAALALTVRTRAETPAPVREAPAPEVLVPQETPTLPPEGDTVVLPGAPEKAPVQGPAADFAPANLPEESAAAKPASPESSSIHDLHSPEELPEKSSAAELASPEDSSIPDLPASSNLPEELSSVEPVPSESSLPPDLPTSSSLPEEPAVEPAPSESSLPPDLPAPEDVAAETIIAALPQEEPLAVDTAAPVLPPEVTQALAEDAPENSPCPGVTQIEPLARTPAESSALPAAAVAPRIVPNEDGPDEGSDAP